MLQSNNSTGRPVDGEADPAELYWVCGAARPIVIVLAFLGAGLGFELGQGQGLGLRNMHRPMMRCPMHCPAGVCGVGMEP